MKDIHEAIKEKRNTIRRIQADLEVLERAAALLNGGSGITHEIRLGENLIIRDGRPGPARLRTAGAHPMKGKVNPKSSTGHALAILRESGVPLHIKEILSRMKKRGKDAKKASLISTMLKLAKKGRIFYKEEAASTFGLMEWHQAKVGAAQ